MLLSKIHHDHNLLIMTRYRNSSLTSQLSQFVKDGFRMLCTKPSIMMLKTGMNLTIKHNENFFIKPNYCHVYYTGITVTKKNKDAVNIKIPQKSLEIRMFGVY